MKSLRNSNSFCGYCDENAILNTRNEKILTELQNILAVQRILLGGIYLYTDVSLFSSSSGSIAFPRACLTLMVWVISQEASVFQDENFCLARPGT